MKAQKGGRFIALPTRYFGAGRGVGQLHAATAVLRATMYRRLDVVRYGCTLVEDYRIFWQDIWIVQDDFLEFVCLFITQDMAM